MDLNPAELVHIRRLWGGLRLFRTEVVSEPASGFNAEKGPLLPRRRTRITTALDDAQMNRFVLSWASNISPVFRTLGPDTTPDTVSAAYQLPAMFTLLTYIMDSWSPISTGPAQALVQVSKINARIWNLDCGAYCAVGEALVATMLDRLGRRVFCPDMEACMIRFYSLVTSVMVQCAGDPVSAFLAEPVTFGHAHNLSFSEQSTLMSRLSLQHSRDDSSFTSADHLSVSTFAMDSKHNQTTSKSPSSPSSAGNPPSPKSKPSLHRAQVNPIVGPIVELDEEDTSFDLLNSFAGSGSEKIKPPKTAKKNKYGPSKGKAPALVGWNHPSTKKQEDCTIT